MFRIEIDIFTTKLCLFILGRGRPSTIKKINEHFDPVQRDELPHTQTAKGMYEEIYDGNIIPESVFGIDPLQDHADLVELRRSEFLRTYDLTQFLAKWPFKDH